MKYAIRFALTAILFSLTAYRAGHITGTCAAAKVCAVYVYQSGTKILVPLYRDATYKDFMPNPVVSMGGKWIVYVRPGDHDFFITELP